MITSRSVITVAALVFCLCWASLAQAENKVLYSDYTYVMGDRDSIIDAKKMSFIEAKRLLIEKAGTLIESETKVTDGRMTKDEISTFAAATVKVEIDNQKVVSQDGRIAVYTRVKGMVDEKSMPKDIAAMRKNGQLQQELKQQKSALDNTHTQIDVLNDRIKKLEAQNASEDKMQTALKRREAALNSNIMQGSRMFCTLACSTAKFKDSEFVQSFFKNMGMGEMLALMMNEEQCSLFCNEINRAVYSALLGQQ